LPLHLVGKRQSVITEGQYAHTRQASADSGSYYGDEDEENGTLGAHEHLSPHSPVKRYQLSENF
jgi:hypothetical protein